MGSQSALYDRRRSSDRRVSDDSTSLELDDRRIRAERRGFEVVELDFDENVALAPTDQRKGIRVTVFLSR
ncbi:hypothetical protein AGMMS50256_20670 [Betaproteobacteria bacterium]|nr:hypothetical protein AGMMS50256_20670 [Betaproteobacteria bacterium]